jgi:hypothetical protein
MKAVPWYEEEEKRVIASDEPFQAWFFAPKLDLVLPLKSMHEGLVL